MVVDVSGFPLTIGFDDRTEVVETLEELAAALAWFDSKASDGSVCVIGNDGRPVSVLIEALEVLRLERVT
jgi:hypothetical protein